MKKLLCLSVYFILMASFINAQPPGRPDQPVYTIPKKDIVKPQNPKLIPITFEQVLDDASWHGTRSWNSTGGVTVDSITTLSFFLSNKQVSWIKRGWEYTIPKPGSYTVSNNRIVIQFSYPPYTHYLEGVYDAATKKITGTFREDRAVIRNPPSAYQAGSTTGQIEFIQK
jgi:hypothetical protein